MGNSETKQAHEAEPPQLSALSQPVSSSYVYTRNVPPGNAYEHAPGEPWFITEAEHGSAMLELKQWRIRQGMSSYGELHVEPLKCSMEAREVYYPAVLRLRSLEESRVKAANTALYEAPISGLNPSELHGESAESQHLTSMATNTNTNGARSVPAAALTPSRENLRDCSLDEGQLSAPSTVRYSQRHQQQEPLYERQHSRERSRQHSRERSRSCERERPYELKAAAPRLTPLQQYDQRFSATWDQGTLDYVKDGMAKGGFGVGELVAETRTRISAAGAALETAAAAAAVFAAVPKDFVPCFWHSYHNTDFLLTGQYSQHEEATCPVLPLTGKLEKDFIREEFATVEATYWRKKRGGKD